MGVDMQTRLHPRCYAKALRVKKSGHPNRDAATKAGRIPGGSTSAMQNSYDFLPAQLSTTVSGLWP
ncbi:hypothetical protein J1614_005194 [Plenodomus biglobosus]|nr:hypothetical protein J1614_005194 [Plenodomus biglobosus]